MGWRATAPALRELVYVCRDMTMPSFISSMLRCLAALAVALTVGAWAAPARAGVEDVLKEIQREGQAQVLVRMKADGGGAVAWSPRLSASRQRVAVATAFIDAAPALSRAQVAT